MSIEKFIDDRIAQAIAEGEFDDLPGKGKPLDLDWYFKLPEDLRVMYSVLRNAGFPPEETTMMKDIEALRLRLESCTDEHERAELRRRIQTENLKLNLLLERNRKPG
jgi:hypothetical protein